MKRLKENVTLQYLDWYKPVYLETDASNRGARGALLQPDLLGHWKPVAFFPKDMSPTEANYETIHKELLTNIHAFEEWRLELEVSVTPLKWLRVVRR